VAITMYPMHRWQLGSFSLTAGLSPITNPLPVHGKMKNTDLALTERPVCKVTHCLVELVLA